MKPKYLFFAIWRGYLVDSWLMGFVNRLIYHPIYVEGKIWKQL